MSWQRYAVALLLFNAARACSWSTALQRLQTVLPGNPNDLAAVDPTVALNTAVSFATNTNWQAYGGETTMSHLVQTLGAHRAELRVGGDRHGRARRADPRLHAQARRRRSATSGSTSTRSTLYILLPLSIVLALLLVSQGVPQTFDARAIGARWSRPPPMPTARGRPSRTSRSARSRRRSRSSSSAPTAAASST